MRERLKRVGLCTRERQFITVVCFTGVSSDVGPRQSQSWI
jgi:hypothetical protein